MKLILTLSVIFLHFASLAQSGNEIYLFDLKIVDGQMTLSNGANFTNHKGYDNQPHFHPSKPLIYYTSFSDSAHSDIKYYNYQTKATSQLTRTREKEYSPTVTPDGKYISCIIQRGDSNQDLGKYPINGGKPIILVNTFKVGYHAWVDKDRVFLFVLVDSTTNDLRYCNLTVKSAVIITQNPGRSLYRIPGKNAMSFIQKNSNKDWSIQQFDLTTGFITTIAPTLPGQENMTWLKDDTILMSDGKGIFSYKVGTDTEWKPVIIEGISALKNISRLATNTNNTKLAVVVAE